MATDSLAEIVRDGMTTIAALDSRCDLCWGAMRIPVRATSGSNHIECYDRAHDHTNKLRTFIRRLIEAWPDETQRAAALAVIEERR